MPADDSTTKPAIKPATKRASKPAAAAALAFDDDVVAQRQAQLELARAQLKRDFVGIDGVIDELCNYVRIWYLMPELLNRPVIVNLWGMTGVGKTDLVRKLVRYLGFQDRFCEVELGGDQFNSTVAGFLTNSGLDDGKPAIVLFDEIQRFATRNADGSDKDNGGKFADFWELLSDGRLARRDRSNLNYMLKDRLQQMEYDRELRRRKPPTPEEQAAQAGMEIGIWDAKQIIALSGIDADVSEVAAWDYPTLEKRLRTVAGSKKVYEPVDHSRTLCIISGNLDEAFTMANAAGEADVDADIFSAYTSKITVVDIKNALLRRFRPEQVARFGNIHLIYRSLRRRDFETLIAREVKRVTTRAKQLTRVDVTVDRSVNDLIYRNGVFPVQGVRPVFSSVNDILETNLTSFLFESVMRKGSNIKVRYDVAKALLIADLDRGAAIRLPYTGRIDTIRQGNQAAVVANVAGHEAGHAVAYCALFGLAPLQLTAKIASSYASGFTFPHQIHESLDHLVARVKVLLAGGLAEDLLFGLGNATVGRQSDREQATMLVADIIRRYGFDAEFQAAYTMEGAHYLDRTVTDIDIEKMIARLVGETRELLRDHRGFLADLSHSLYQLGALDGAAVAQIAGRNGVAAAVKPEGHLHVVGYEAMLPQK
jgi:hypothetical protein